MADPKRVPSDFLFQRIAEKHGLDANSMTLVPPLNEVEKSSPFKQLFSRNEHPAPMANLGGGQRERPVFAENQVALPSDYMGFDAEINTGSNLLPFLGGEAAPDPAFQKRNSSQQSSNDLDLNPLSSDDEPLASVALRLKRSDQTPKSQKSKKKNSRKAHHCIRLTEDELLLIRPGYARKEGVQFGREAAFKDGPQDGSGVEHRNVYVTSEEFQTINKQTRGVKLARVVPTGRTREAMKAQKDTLESVGDATPSSTSITETNKAQKDTLASVGDMKPSRRARRGTGRASRLIQNRVAAPASFGVQNDNDAEEGQRKKRKFTTEDEQEHALEFHEPAHMGFGWQNKRDAAAAIAKWFS